MSRCDICLSDENTGVACEDCSRDTDYEIGQATRPLRRRIRVLRAALQEIRSVSNPIHHCGPGDVCKEPGCIADRALKASIP